MFFIYISDELKQVKMNFNFIFILFMIFNSSSYSAEAIKVDSQSAKTTKSCDLTVYFGSFGTGVDHKTKKKIKSFLESTDSISQIEYWYSGKEGESTFCVTLKNSKDKEQIISLIKKMIPSKGRGPIQVGK